MQTEETSVFGRTLRFWRQTLHIRQEELALELNISRKHLSFLETGRSTPGKDLVFKIAEALHLHERDINNLLVAAGYAPTALAMPSDEVGDLWRRKAINIMLKGLDPLPCYVRDRYGYIKAVNRGWVAYNYYWLGDLIFDAPLNIYNLWYHDKGWSGLIKNWDEVGWQSILALKQELLFSPNSEAEQLYREITERPAVRQALEKHMQLAFSANVSTVKVQRDDGPIQTSTAITTTFTEDSISEPRLLIDTWYPRDFEFPYTKDELQTDQTLHHPLLYCY